MAWVKIDDEMPDHPKYARAGPCGLAWMIAALAYCNKYGTNGFIPTAKAHELISFRGIMLNGQPVTCERIIDRLCEPLPSHNGSRKDPPLAAVNGGYAIHDYHDYQPPTMEERRRRARAVRQRGGEKRASTATRSANGRFANNVNEDE